MRVNRQSKTNKCIRNLAGCEFKIWKNSKKDLMGNELNKEWT